MRIRPIGNKVLVKDLSINDEGEEKVLAGGIIMPATANKFETSDKYVKVIDISKAIKDPQFKIGDTVMVNLYVGTEVDVDGEKLLLIEPEDIYGIKEE